VLPTADERGKPLRGFWVQMLFPYVNKRDGKHLSFQQGEFLRVTARESELGWWAVTIGGDKGWIPPTYASILPGQEAAIADEEARRVRKKAAAAVAAAAAGSSPAPSPR
jgi:hypothetical protein